MRFEREIGGKGQVVIPKDIRELLGMQAYSKIIFQVENDEVKIKRSDSKEIMEKFFSIARTKGKDLTLKELKEIEESSYDLP